MMAAIAATIVLPEPTSPWSRRFIGCGFAISFTISQSDCFCDCVSEKGSSARICLMRSMSIAISGACSLLELQFLPEIRELEQEEIFEPESFLRRERVLDMVGEMDLPQGALRDPENRSARGYRCGIHSASAGFRFMAMRIANRMPRDVRPLVSG